MAVNGYDEVCERIARAAERAGRSPSDVGLVAVSKNRSAAAIREVHARGQVVFGENRQQGLAARLEQDLPSDIAWHFIGPLQSRKAPFVSKHVSLLHSFDRMSLIKKWAGSDTPVLLQFNMADEPQKSGFRPDEAERAFEEVTGAGVRVKGVMAIPPQVTDPEDSRIWFVALREIFDRLRRESATIDTLSMGMSNDYEVAIAEGATLVRVGTAIFGPVTDT